MEFVKIYNYIEQFNSLLQNECTGTAPEFAKKLGISERTLRNHLQQLREIGIVVVYDHHKRTYRYPSVGKIVFSFCPKGTNENKVENVLPEDILETIDPN